MRSDPPSRDLVTARQDITCAAVRKAFDAGGHGDYRIEVLPVLNHLFQTSTTGSPGEYERIEETFAPAALEMMADWIEARTGR